MNKKRKNRYKHVDGKRWIEVRVKSQHQLFDARDPAPFLERDLDDDFVEYIISSIQEFSMSTPLKIVVYIDEVQNELSEEAIREAIQAYFSYQVDLQERGLKIFLRRAQVYLLIGFSVLITCVSIAQSLPVLDSPTAFSVAREGVTIFGWVSIWKPIELILFDWYPLFEKMRIYRKAISIEMDLRFKMT